MRTAFFGTSQFAVPVLEALVRGGHSIAPVVTQPDRPAGRGREIRPGAVKRVATELGLEVIQPERVKSPEFRDAFRRFEPLDAAVCAAFGQIIPQWLLDVPRLGFLNVHPSLLPKYRGAAPIQRAIMAGETVTGVTIMLMDAGLDTGPILVQRDVQIDPDEDAGSLSARLAEIGAQMVLEALKNLDSGTAVPRPQDDAQATYASLIGPEDAEIDWSAPAEQIVNLVRALSAKPGAHTRAKGHALKVWRARCESVAGTRAEPRTVVAMSEDGIVVAAGEGCVKLLEVQAEGRKRMSAAEFARGARIGVWDSFK